MKQHFLSKLEAIANQANNIYSTQPFFPFLQEFCLVLLINPCLQNELNLISAKETDFQVWFDNATKLLPSENRELYFAQYKGLTDWYALNQLRVFFERFDFAYHDTLIKELVKQDIDVQLLQNEHKELMEYQISGICSKKFPTLEEYKSYMRRVIEVLREILSPSSISLVIYPCKFDKKTSALLISNSNPLKFMRNENPSVLLGYVSENMWKNMSEKDILNDLCLERDEIKRTVRQINERVEKALFPSLLTFINHPHHLDEKIVALSASYIVVQ